MIEFRPSTPHDEPQIVGLLACAFSVGLDAPFLNPMLVRWKYWEPCRQWPEPRSWVGEQDGRIVAHACLWPVTLETGEHGAAWIDWAADRRFSGAGRALVQHLARSHAFICAIGGSPKTQAILPSLGFETVGDALTWARPLRPWRAARDQPLSARFVRSIWSALMPPRLVPRGFSTAPLSVRGDEILGDPPRPSCERDLSFVQFLGSCPVFSCLAFDIRNRQRKVGWFVLAAGRRQVRVAGIWLENPSPENWRMAFNLAQRAARHHTDATEILARCATRESCLGAEQAGMKLQNRQPIFLSWADGRALGLPIECQMCNDDAVFLNID